MKLLKILRNFIPGLILLVSGSSAMGQNTIDFAAGAGFPELVNLGLRFQLGQSQLGIYGGTLPGVDNMVFTLGADYYYHFGGASKLSTRRPWYAKAGLNYIHDESEFIKETSLFLVPRIGRDLNISRRIGIALEAGAFLLLSYSEVEIKPRESPCFLCGGAFFSFGPSLGLSVFYRL